MFQWAGLLETAPWAVGFTNKGKGRTNKREYIWVLGARLAAWLGRRWDIQKHLDTKFLFNFFQRGVYTPSDETMSGAPWVVPGDEVMEEEPRGEMKSGERGG